MGCRSKREGSVWKMENKEHTFIIHAVDGLLTVNEAWNRWSVERMKRNKVASRKVFDAELNAAKMSSAKGVDEKTDN
jgi:hypothetical protein